MITRLITRARLFGLPLAKVRAYLENGWRVFNGFEVADAV